MRGRHGKGSTTRNTNLMTRRVYVTPSGTRIAKALKGTTQMNTAHSSLKWITWGIWYQIINVNISLKKNCGTNILWTSLLLDLWLLSTSYMYMYIIAKFIVSHFEFCKLRRNLGFFCSVNRLSGPLRKHMFTCNWCISIHFVCFCVSRFAACDCPVSHCFGRWLTSFYQSFLWSFLFLPLARIKQCLPPALDTNSTHDHDFLPYSWAV